MTLTQTLQKDHLALRADVKAQTDALNALLASKKIKLEEIRDRAKMLGSFIMSGHLSKMDDILAEDQAVIDEINAIDYEIRKVQDSLAAAFGVNTHDLERCFKHNAPEYYKQYKGQCAQIASLAREKNESLEKAIANLEKEMHETKRAIHAREEIENIRKLLD